MARFYGRRGVRGLTLIELTIAIAIAAMAVGVMIGGLNALTNASLKSASLDLAGTIKLAYDRAIMARHTERLSLDMDKGLYWLDYTEDQFSISKERMHGREGEKLETKEKEEEEKAKRMKKESFFDDDKDSGKAEVMQALEGGKAIQFAPDVEVFKEPALLTGDVRISKVWTGHQEESFTTGVAYLHFFNSGWSEPAQIELTDGDEFVTIKVYPLTGRVRIYDKEMDAPKPEDDDDGRDEGDL